MYNVMVIYPSGLHWRAHGHNEGSRKLANAETQQPPWDSLEIKFTGNVFACSCVPSWSFAYQDYTGVSTGIICVLGTQLPLAGFTPNQVHWNCIIGILEYLRAPGILGCNPILQSQPTTTWCWYIFCHMFLSHHAMPQLLSSWCHCKTTRSC